MKQEKGITLIALVITIIVLLILAGVAIAMVSGDGNIPGKAKEAKVQTSVSETKSGIATAAAAELADFFDYKYNGKIPTPAKATAYGPSTTAQQAVENGISTTPGAYSQGVTVGVDTTNHKISFTVENVTYECSIDANGGLGNWNH